MHNTLVNYNNNNTHTHIHTYTEHTMATYTRVKNRIDHIPTLRKIESNNTTSEWLSRLHSKPVRMKWSTEVRGEVRVRRMLWMEEHSHTFPHLTSPHLSSTYLVVAYHSRRVGARQTE
jgi:hypothetical protein